MTHHRVILVGAGPIGIELAVVLKRMGVDCLHLEAGAIGQTISWYPKQATFFSSPDRIAVAGVPLVSPDQSKATREQYLAYLRSVVQQFDLPIHTHEPVRRAEHLAASKHESDAGSTRFVVHTPRRSASADHLVLAIGDMHLPRNLEIPGEDLPHVSHYFDEPHDYFRRNLLIVGGRNSAAEAALRCHHAGAKVTLSYRGDSLDDNGIKYWLLPELKSLIKHNQIAYHPETIPTRITDTRVTLNKVKKVSDTFSSAGTSSSDDAHLQVPADHVLLLTGYAQDKTLFQMLGVELVGENQAPVIDPDTMQTNVENLYIAGTAAAGTQQRFKLFIENCHRHALNIAQAITGEKPPKSYINQAAKTFGLEES